MTIYDACEKLNKFAEKWGPAGVARAMRLTKCSGVPQDPDTCVLHHYLSKKHPGTKELLVTFEAAMWNGRWHLERYCFGERLQAFIGNFDAGEYPELEVKPCE